MARRAKGEGSFMHILPVKCEKCKDFANCVLRKDASGKCSKRDRREFWRYQYNVPGLDGKPVRRVMEAKTRKELERRVEQMRQKNGAGSNDTVTVGQWCDRWISAVLPTTVKESTLSNYRSMLNYIPESVRNKKLLKLNLIDLQQMFTDLKDHGSKVDGGCLSSRTVGSIRKTLITCLQSAIDNKIIPENVAKKTKPPVNDNQREISFLDEGEILRLLAVADRGEYYEADSREMDPVCMAFMIKQWAMVIRLALATGIRLGEVFGLTWGSVDFSKSSISIKTKLRKGKLESPKTKNSTRKISVDADTMKRLKNWKQHQLEYANGLGDLYHNKLDTVFTGAFGNPVDFDNFRNRIFNHMIVKAGLAETITFHSLRHTHATQLLANGVDVKTVSRRLGHASAAFTLQTYIHVLPDIERNAANVMGNIMAGKKPRKTHRKQRS